jgi:hypothetical protein
MMRFPAVRNRLLILHILLILILTGSAGFAAWRLLALPPDPIGAAALVVLVLGGILLPAVVHRTYLLLTADYEIAPAGGLTLRIGPRREVVPIDEIEEIRSGSKIPDAVRNAAPGWLDGWQGSVAATDGEAVEWIATDRGPRLLLLITKHRRLAVSPADPAGFAGRLTEITAQGSLEKIEPISIHPPPILSEIFRNPPAAGLLIGGLAVITGLGAFLTGIQPALPAEQPFRFDPSGLPTSLGDPRRLLLLPAAGGAVWVLNALIGWWAWRKGQRPAAYALWITALLSTAGLWVAYAFLFATN